MEPGLVFPAAVVPGMSAAAEVSTNAEPAAALPIWKSDAEQVPLEFVTDQGVVPLALTLTVTVASFS